MSDFFSRLSLGNAGEVFASFIICKKLGLQSIILKFGSDLQISNGLLLEVKTIRQNKDGHWKATVEKQGSQRLGKSNFVLLFIIADDLIYSYIIPKNVVSGKRITISSHPTKYNGKYSKYLNNWEQLIIPKGNLT